MAKRRSSEVVLCFDSMTDLITNLAGGLLLIVLLLLGITRPALSQTPPRPAAKDQRGDGDKSVAPLRERVNLLQREIGEVDKRLKQLNQNLPALKGELEDLLRRANALQPPKPAEKAAERPKARDVAFRPPFMKIARGKKEIGFLVENRRVSVVDYAAIKRDLIAALGGEDAKPTGRVPVSLEMPGSDFRVEGTIEFRDPLQIDLTMVRKPGANGEALAEIRRPDSRFQAALRAHSAKDFVVTIMAYHDSFDAMPEVRQLAWDADFEVGWEPKAPGEPMRLSTGGVITTG